MLVAVWPELLALARHEVERTPFREPHDHPLEEVEVSRKVPLAYRVHCRFLILQQLRLLERSFEYM